MFMYLIMNGQKMQIKNPRHSTGTKGDPLTITYLTFKREIYVYKITHAVDI